MLKKLILVAFVVAGCASEPSSEVCNSGIICPSGTKCAAAQAVCLVTDCGDGIIEANEACDDGNIIDGDGCAHDCKKEGCGNGTVDPGEDCDPPGSTSSSGIPCSTSCKFEICGNMVVDPDTHEQCDDGSGNTDTPCPTPAYDATMPNTCSTCTTSCVIHTVIGPSCGDHVCQASLGENLSNCPGDCAGCGNGSIDQGEECDLGSGNTDTPCATPTYHNPPNTCSTCTSSCTINTVVGPFCGDGACNNGETGTTCPGDCTGCGNGLVEGSEQCDNGANNTDTPCTTPTYHNPPLSCSTCTTSCTTNTVVGPFCGDGVCSNGETKISCSTDCTGCGDGHVTGNEQCDEGQNNTNSPCQTPSYNNPPNACQTCTTSCTINTVIGPYCGDGTCSNGENKTTCPADCQGCGNGIVGGSEQCDNGAANTNTPCATPAYNASPPNTCSTCNTSCQLNTVVGPFCGDGTCANGETKTSCPADCNGCGNGIKEGSEQCDNGAGNTATPCATPSYNASAPNTCSTCNLSCQINTVLGPYCGDNTCSNGETKTTCPDDCSGCGNGIKEGSEQCDNGAGNTNTPCATPSYSAGPPNTCSTCTTACLLDTVTGPYCGDGTCQSADGETSTNCPNDCAGCGNGVLDSGEQCDDGSLNTNTQCSAPAYHNPPNTCSTCTLACTLSTRVGPYCGDGIKNGGEDCDGTDGTACSGNKTGAICTSGCILDTSHCM